MTDSKKEMSFEESIKKLEEIVKKLEGGDDSLEKSLNLFEEGVKLARYCDDKLDEAEKKLEVLMRKGDEVVKEEVDEEKFFNSGVGRARDED